MHRLGEASEQAQEAGRIDEGVMWAIGGRLSAIGDSPAYRRPAERRRAHGEVAGIAAEADLPRR